MQTSNYRTNLVTAPAAEPITTSEAKTHLRVDSSTDDTYIGTLITIARSSAEKYTRRAFINQTWQMFLDPIGAALSDEWWTGVRQGSIRSLSRAGSLVIPFAPLVSVTHIKFYDDADTATTFSPGNYQVSAYAGDSPANGRITLRTGAVWPSIDGAGLRNSDAMEIQFVAGYGTTGASVPTQIKQGILAEISQLYENRGDCSDGVNSSLARSLLNPYRILEF
jgi:uncharacterized phiE125 gp8 family phage protein